MGIAMDILKGEHDEMLDAIRQAVSERKDTLGRALMFELNPGDIVRCIGGRPRYLNGVRCEVVRCLQKNVMLRVVEEDRVRARRFGHGQFRSPLSMIEKVTR